MSTNLDKLSDDDLSRAVLQAMWPLPDLIVTGVIAVPQTDIDNAKCRCVSLRKWLSEQQMSNRVRGAYLHWIEHCENSIVRAEDELRTGSLRREFEAGQQRLRDEQQRASLAATNLPRPPR